MFIGIDGAPAHGFLDLRSPPPLRAPSRDGGARKRPRRLRVLVVEDEALAALYLEDILTDLGHVVVGRVANGPAAVSAAERLEPDLVLMDIRLGRGTDGVLAAEEIRDRFGTPIIFQTAHTDPGTLLRAERTKPLGFITKPYSKEQVEAALRPALASRRRRT